MAFTAVRGTSLPSTAARFEVPRFDTRDVPSADSDAVAISVPRAGVAAWTPGDR
jgi:hypothetical protein